MGTRYKEHGHRSEKVVLWAEDTKEWRDSVAYRGGRDKGFNFALLLEYTVLQYIAPDYLVRISLRKTLALFEFSVPEQSWK